MVQKIKIETLDFTKKKPGRKSNQTSTKNSPAECDVCGKICRTKYLLRAHLQTHSKFRSHECKICAKSFKTKDILKKHGAVHQQTKPHECSQCGKFFKTVRERTQHKNISHSKIKDINCEKCDKKFKTQRDLNQHHFKHAGKTFVCLVCQKSFYNNSKLKFHLKIEKHAMNYKCEKCLMKFLSYTQLKQHWMKHCIEL